jgi:hypothetical protein
LLSLRTELRSNRLNGSGTNKIVRSRPATPCSIKRSKGKFLAQTWSTQYDQEQDCRGGSGSFCFGTTCVSPGAIQEPGAFEFYHPNGDVLNADAPMAAAALASTDRAQKAYAAIDDAGIATRKVGKGICHREPQVGAFATQPWSSGSPCAPAAGY